MHTHNINDSSSEVGGGSLMKILEDKSPIVPPDCKGGSLQEKRAHTRAQRLGRHKGRRENIKRSSFIEI